MTRKNISLSLIYITFICAAISSLLVLSATRITAQQNGPQQIIYGQTVTGDLTAEKPEVLYTFTAAQGDSIVITLDSTGGGFDPLVILTDVNQQSVLAVDNDSGGNRNARLRYVIQAAGDYIIKVTAVQGSGDAAGTFQLGLTLGSSNATPGLASNAAALPQISPLNAGEEASGTLDDTVKFRLYAIRARAGSPIIASLDIPNTPDKLQAGLYLYNGAFNEVSRAELGQPLNVSAPTDGVYFIMVARAAATGSGSYTLRQTLPQAPTSATAITIGQTVRGLINNDSAVKTYSLQGAEGKEISVQMRRLSGDLLTYVYVVAVDSGQTLAQGTDNNGVAELTTVLPASGSFAVVATRAGQQTGITTGEFTLTIAKPGETPPLPSAFQNYATLNYGDTPTGTIDSTTFVVPYVFTAQTGDIIQATLTTVEGSGDLDPYLLLQDVDTKTLAEDNNSGGGTTARLQAVIPQTGQYALIATRTDLEKGTTSGQFKLEFNKVAAPPSTKPVSIGTLISVGAAQAGDSTASVGAIYRFESSAEAAVNVDISTPDGFSSVNVLTNSDFVQLAASSGAIPTTALPKEGTYYIFIIRSGGPNQAAVGTYTLTLQGNITPPPTLPPNTLTFGEPMTGTITNDIYQQRYVIQAKAGMSLTVTAEAAEGSTLDPLIGVTDSDNNVLGVNDDSAQGIANASLNVTIPKDGLYNIVVTRAQEAAGTTTGDFVLTVNVVNTQPDLLPIRYGGIVNAEITNEQFLYYYTFSGKVGDIISIKMNTIPGNDLDPVLYLYDYSTGQPVLLTGNNDSAAGSQDAAVDGYTLPNTGIYLIAATRLDAANGKTTGSFVLSLNVAQ
jgi:hypothetical protein